MTPLDHARTDITLVIDIGKSHAKLLWVDDRGNVVDRCSRDNSPVMSRLGYPALDVEGLTHWLCESLKKSTVTRYCQSVIATTHGAAFVALDDDGIAWAPLDYEFDGFASAPKTLAVAYLRERGDFAETLSPDFPVGLNAAKQLYWLQHTYPQAWAKTRYLLPYPQYWAWWLSGIASNEVSSLGCHTQLWAVQRQAFSQLACAQGWAERFAPMQSAWHVLGCVRPELAEAVGLPHHCAVHVGVHDSNACLARYLQQPKGLELSVNHPSTQHVTLVSSGTWTVVMAPGADVGVLQAERDMLGNVNVLGQPTPTARFMGGREFAVLLNGAAANAGSESDLVQLVATQTMALPTFSGQHTPDHQQGVVMRAGCEYALQELPDAQRAALAALYCAQMTASLVESLRPEVSMVAMTELVNPQNRLVVEGPLAANQLYMGVLQALLRSYVCYASVDPLEGTARGAWMLARWSQPQNRPDCNETCPTENAFLQAAGPLDIPGLRNYHQHWVQRCLNDGLNS